MKKNSIVRKLIITFSSITGGLLILVGLVLSVGFYRISHYELINTLNKQLDVVSEAVGKYLKYQDGSYEDISRLLQISCLTNNMSGVVVDRLGYVYMVSSNEYSDFKYTNIDIENSKIPTDDKIIHKKVLIDGKSNLKVSAFIKPIFTNSQLDGYIIMVENNPVNERRTIIIIWTAIVLAVIVAGAIVKYFAQLLVVEPIEEINNSAKRLAKGNVQERVKVVGKNEIGELAQSFNTMAQSIEEADNIRKEFISNVSHELRSPITSIKGFVGGILDGVIPRDKENYYLKIVYDEIDRLARLVNDLLDISAMESGKFNLHISEFDINQTVSLCILNLENKIKTKNLNVKAIFHEKRCFAIGDRDRILQVITNLLENAIKYSEDNGQIEVNISTKSEKIFVSIFNSGNILSEYDLNHIWDRFYKSDKSRTNKISTGLGLPIVRLILSQHNQDIWVENVDDKGVKFVFTLQRNN
ncbi:cell wall metabolism sensor histidine kinase WalK [Clostridium sp.]|uniref:sensor histidine kinase n=1 Tax=Clostridium sp. TaxID=1506 RepID=UPI0025C37DCE|nr:HAMP domain-containing sensor histidine kinase [Clostridium sp.]MCI9069723.1 cell wall metabolism sensor histidine kinase WalK [Clostridium sp.]MCI9304673.1 cell wall metabolism sensor histidine kinase WalK [Clostridium sp.]